jgi:hypothetical protein
MLDYLSFHTDRDLHAELATLNREIAALIGRVDMGHFHSWEHETNTRNQLDHLTCRAGLLAEEIAQADADTDRLVAAIRTVGDADLGFIAYVVYGPKVLPVPPLYEVRVIERLGGIGGYTVPGSVRRRVTADQVAETEREVLHEVLRPGGHADVWGCTHHAYRTQVVAY